MNPQVVAVFNPTVDPAYTLTKFEIEEAGGADRAFLYSNAGICWLAFQDTDTTFANFASDWGNNMNWAPVEKWGFTGLHAGLVNELEGLIGLMDFASMRDECSVSFSVAGYSLGGSLAQMFAVLINAAHDPLDADLRVDELYSFGAFAPMASEARNDKAADGCFAGAQYSVAYSTSTGGYAADVVYSTDVGGHVHSFGHSNRAFILPDGSQKVFPCGTPLPEGQDLFKDLLQGDWTPYLQAHASYPFLLGCVAPATEATTTVAPTAETEAAECVDIVDSDHMLCTLGNLCSCEAVIQQFGCGTLATPQGPVPVPSLCCATCQEPTTGAWPTPAPTSAPTTATVAPTTVAPTTVTEAPTTGAWPTPAPTTAPTTVAPTTVAPTTVAPTTVTEAPECVDTVDSDHMLCTLGNLCSCEAVFQHFGCGTLAMPHPVPVASLCCATCQEQ